MNMEPTIDTITLALDFNDQLDDAGIMYSCERWLDGYKWTFSDSAYEGGDIIILNFGTFGMFVAPMMTSHGIPQKVWLTDYLGIGVINNVKPCCFHSCYSVSVWSSIWYYTCYLCYGTVCT